MIGESEEESIAIREALLRGPTKTHRNEYVQNLRVRIAKYRTNGDSSLAGYFDLALSQLEATISSAEAIEKALEIAHAPYTTDLARYLALGLANKLSVFVFPLQKSLDLHTVAEDIAAKNKWHALHIWSLAHRVLTSLYRDDPFSATRALRRARGMLSSVTMDEIRRTPEARFCEARLIAHHAKLFALLCRKRQRSNRSAAGIVTALYDKVVELESSDDHFRINHLTECSEVLLQLHQEGVANALSLVKETLERAVTGLDTHVCDLCRGYFYQIRGQAGLAEARESRPRNTQLAVSVIQSALSDARKSDLHFSQTAHASTKFSSEIIVKIGQELDLIDRPKRVFLSHKGANKPKVRRYEAALSSLGYDPWLDEKDLVAGSLKDRGILEGIKSSCAVVFFITPEFMDVDYLADELDYAIEEWRSRKTYFSIITLLLRNEQGDRGIVPSLLERFIYKSPEDDLDGLVEIVRALPLRPEPYWPQ